MIKDKTVLVTRASSGIGQELAWQLGQCGAKLTVAARRQETLEREQIVTGHGTLLVLVERFAPQMMRTVARRQPARPRT